MKLYMAVLGLLVGLLGSGCSTQLKEIRGKTKFGPEFRNAVGRSLERWTSIDQEVEFKLTNGWSTIVSYRRRDVNDGAGGNDNRVLLGFSYPIWKQPEKPDATLLRIRALEERLAQVEGAQQADMSTRPTAAHPRDASGGPDQRPDRSYPFGANREGQKRVVK